MFWLSGTTKCGTSQDLLQIDCVNFKKRQGFHRKHMIQRLKHCGRRQTPPYGKPAAVSHVDRSFVTLSKANSMNKYTFQTLALTQLTALMPACPLLADEPADDGKLRIICFGPHPHDAEYKDRRASSERGQLKVGSVCYANTFRLSPVLSKQNNSWVAPVCLLCLQHRCVYTGPETGDRRVPWIPMTPTCRTIPRTPSARNILPRYCAKSV
jgi:hypothetical protein